MSDYGEATDLIDKTLGNLFLYFHNIMSAQSFKQIFIIAHENINHLPNKNEVLMSVSLDNIVSAHGASMAWNGESLGGGVLSFLLIPCNADVSNQTYIYKGENQLSAEHIGLQASVKLCQLMNHLRHKEGKPW